MKQNLVALEDSRNCMFNKVCKFMWRCSFLRCLRNSGKIVSGKAAYLFQGLRFTVCSVGRKTTVT